MLFYWNVKSDAAPDVWLGMCELSNVMGVNALKSYI